jgi:hypothetical protein
MHTPSHTHTLIAALYLCTENACDASDFCSLTYKPFLLNPFYLGRGERCRLACIGLHTVREMHMYLVKEKNAQKVCEIDSPRQG